MSPTGTADIPGIERFWRAANYLTLSALYLRTNPLVPQVLTPTDVKPVIVGHWGVCPALNAVYAHTCDLVRRRERPVSLVVGPGHAGPALLACLYLDGTLESMDPTFTRNGNGLRHLINAYGSSAGFPTEITAAYPGVEYVGGELGQALAFAQGTVMGDPGRLVVCVIGDGELETSIAQSGVPGIRPSQPHRRRRRSHRDQRQRLPDGVTVPVVDARDRRSGAIPGRAWPDPHRCGTGPPPDRPRVRHGLCQDHGPSAKTMASHRPANSEGLVRPDRVRRDPVRWQPSRAQARAAARRP